MSTPPPNAQSDPSNDSSAAVTPPGRGERRKRAAYARKKLLELLWDGQLTPLEAVEELGLSGTRAARLLERPHFQRSLETLLTLADARRRLMQARASQLALSRLADLTSGEGETARKACLDLLAIFGNSPGAAERPSNSAETAAPEDSDVAPLEQHIDELLTRLAQEQDSSAAVPAAAPVEVQEQ